MAPLLEVKDLTVRFRTEDGVVNAVDGVSYSVDAGKTLGIVGESGSGKSVSSLTVMGLTRAKNADITGQVLFQGQDLVTATESQMRVVRGGPIAMIFQDPMSSLHPMYRVGTQLVEAVRMHQKVSKSAARDRAAQMLSLVGIPDPKARMNAYPHEFSGGMRQRVMIAMGLCNDPKMLIADEPTTALDVTVQAQILELIERLQSELDTAVIMITHDLGVVAEVTDDIAVMYCGRIVERGPKADIFARPEHPYTWGLLTSIPRLDTPRDQELVPIAGRPPSLINRPAGCHFHPRCPYARPGQCDTGDVLLEPSAASPAHVVRCVIPSAERTAIWAALKAGETPQGVDPGAPPPLEKTLVLEHAEPEPETVATDAPSLEKKLTDD
ncbi:ABC transporter [Paraconexibacter sp. AEG42_29]|uniref:ABC transporter n=1 Tax=Paraconexibacter sp. AEG42_29 TaxID=2997339 RepID=A0AAU7B393_9ACTN